LQAQAELLLHEVVMNLYFFRSVKMSDICKASALQIDAKIVELKQMMKEASQGLRFEEAAKLRDEVKKLTDLRFML
jgi:excinuclease UvrABC nuclease subunit